MKASESNVQTRVRLECSRRGWYVFRNNLGAGYLQDGSFVRWGLANDAREMNTKVKSSDLVGWREVVITPDMVGQKIAQFVSLECKREGWRYTGTEVEVAQRKWLDTVARSGGFATFVTDPSQF